MESKSNNDALAPLVESLCHERKKMTASYQVLCDVDEVRSGLIYIASNSWRENGDLRLSIRRIAQLLRRIEMSFLSQSEERGIEMPPSLAITFAYIVHEALEDVDTLLHESDEPELDDSAPSLDFYDCAMRHVESIETEALNTIA